MKIEIRNNDAYIFTPYNPEFVSKIKKNVGGAYWDSCAKAWVVPAPAVDNARKIMMDVYGETDLPETSGRLTLSVTATRELSKYCGPIVLFGKIIASAHGRDSGAYPGEDVCFILGDPDSGGSSKNWKTVIPKGSEFRIFNVPRSMYEKYIETSEEYPDIEVENITCDIDVKALKEEREKLLKRLEEIDDLLKSAE